MESDNQIKQVGYSSKKEDSGLESCVNQEHVFESEEEGLFRKVTDIYFKPKSFEKWRNGKIYEFIGIKPFKKFVLWTAEKIPPKRKRGNEPNGSNYYIGKDISTKRLKKFESRTRFNELIHGGGTGYITYIVGKSLVQGYQPSIPTGILIGSIILFSAYLTFLQRYHRIKVQNVLERKAKIKKPLK